MIKQLPVNRAWARYVVAVLLVVLAASLRIWPLHILGSTLAWLTFYPAVMVVAIYGGLSAGLLATALSCLIVAFCWPILAAEPFISDLSGWLGMSVFILTGGMISGLAEAMHRAQACAIKAQEQTEAANIALKKNGLVLNQYAAIIDSSDDAIISKSLDGFIISWNHAAERMFGYTLNEALGRSIHMLIPEEYQREEDVFLDRISKGETIKHYETVRRCKDGKLIDISVTLSPIQDAYGHIVGVSKIAHDITHRRRADELLRKSEERYRALFDNMLDGFAFCRVLFEKDKPTDLIYINVNKAFTTLTGLSEVTGKRLSNVVPGLRETNPEILETYGRVVLTGVPEQFETYLEPLRIWLFVTVYSPEKEHFVAIFQNITEQKKFIEEIRIAAATFETHDAIVITDAEANIIKVNRAFTKVTGYTQEEVAGKNPRIMNSGRHDKAFFENLFQVVLSEGSWEGEIWDKRKNGEIYPRSMTVTAIKDAQNKITSFVGIFRDITERKQAEEALRKAEQRFRFMLENSPIAVRIASKATGKVVYANRNYAELIGYPQEQAIGIDPQQFYANQQDYYDIAEQLGKGENVINKLVKLDSKSELKWALASFMLSEFENEPAYLAWLYDISDRKKMEEQVEHLAFYDTLTELPNRRLLNDRLQQAVYANKRSGKYGVVMFLDLDKFKPLNDTHGHVVGDLLLLEVGRRISSCVRDTDTVARFGGDEFVVMLNELDIDETQSKTESGNVAEKIRACLSETYFLKTQQEGAEICVEHHCSSSIGVTLFNGHELNHDVIFKQADAAMYKAKEGGGNLVCLYEEGMDDL